MSEAQKYLIDNHYADLVIGKDGDKFIYVSDVIEKCEDDQHIKTRDAAAEIIEKMPKFHLGKASIVGPVISQEHTNDAIKNMEKPV